MMRKHFMAPLFVQFGVVGAQDILFFSQPLVSTQLFYVPESNALLRFLVHYGISGVAKVFPLYNVGMVSLSFKAKKAIRCILAMS